MKGSWEILMNQLENRNDKIVKKTGLPLHYLDMIWHLSDRTNISKEEFDEEFGQWIIDFPRTELPHIYQLLEHYGEGKEIHIFHSREDAEYYLESV